MQTSRLIRRTSGTAIDDVVFTIVLSIFAVSVVALSAFVFIEGSESASVAANEPRQPQRVGAFTGESVTAPIGAPRA
jgi:hypothetical protein